MQDQDRQCICDTVGRQARFSSVISPSVLLQPVRGAHARQPRPHHRIRGGLSQPGQVGLRGNQRGWEEEKEIHRRDEWDW